MSDLCCALLSRADGFGWLSSGGAVSRVGAGDPTTAATRTSLASSSGTTASTTRTPSRSTACRGASVDCAHVFADGGGRGFAYVAMSRARDTSRVYVVVDDLDQAVEDLTVEWSSDRRKRWVLDVDEPALDDRARRPSLARRTERTLHMARLRAELDAVKAVAPEAEARLRSLDLQLRLEYVGQHAVRVQGIRRT